MRSGILYRQNGIVLVSSLFLLVALLIVASIALLTTSMDLRVIGIFKSNKRAFYLAEAGMQEAMARMRKGAANYIGDVNRSEPNWAVYIGSLAKTQERGYDSGNPFHFRFDSMQPDMGYSVKIVHQKDGAGNLLYWGDINRDGVNERSSASGTSMRNIYLVSSEGVYANSKRTIEAEISPMPPVNAPSALYVKAATVKGSSTGVVGTDACGGGNISGIASSRPPGSITVSGSPTIAGAPAITYDAPVMNTANLINTYKGSANFSYAVANATHTAATLPGPGQGWGTPLSGATPESPLTCDANNIVYYNTGGTEIQLSGGVYGCGMLLVEGNLKLTGGFSWYGPIMTTGSVTFLGGGNKNITGAVLTGNSATNAEDDVIGGNTNITYCSEALNSQTESMAMQVLSWQDKASQ